MIHLSEKILQINQALSIKYNNLVYELKQKGSNIITLSLGEAFFDIPLFPMDNLPLDKVYHYTHSRGITELRNEVSKYYFNHFGVSFNPETEIMITAGSKAAIYFALLAILNPDEEVIVQEPTWVSYPEMVKMCGGKIVKIPHNEKLEDYPKYINEKTKAIIINNPHNPSGYQWKKDEIEFIHHQVKKNNLFLIADEAYSDFTLQDDFISAGKICSDFNNVIICNSISKNFGISGWRIGYVITNSELINEIIKINQHIITCPPSILQYYMAFNFDEIIKITYPQIKSVVTKRNEIAEFAKYIGLNLLEGNSTFYLFVSIAPTKLTSDEFCTRLLIEESVCVVPGIGYGDSCDSFVRVSVGAESDENIKVGLEKIKKLIDQTK